MCRVLCTSSGWFKRIEPPIIVNWLDDKIICIREDSPLNHKESIETSLSTGILHIILLCFIYKWKIISGGCRDVTSWKRLPTEHSLPMTFCLLKHYWGAAEHAQSHTRREIQTSVSLPVPHRKLRETCGWTERWESSRSSRFLPRFSISPTYHNYGILSLT